MDEKINFSIFCLENYKVYKKISGKKAYDIFEKYGVFLYLNEFYDVLHSTGYQYINNDIDIYLSARNFSLN